MPPRHRHLLARSVAIAIITGLRCRHHPHRHNGQRQHYAGGGISTLNDNVSIASAGTVAISTGIDFQGQSIGIQANGSITKYGQQHHNKRRHGRERDHSGSSLCRGWSTRPLWRQLGTTTNGGLGAAGFAEHRSRRNGSQTTASPAVINILEHGQRRHRRHQHRHRGTGKTIHIDGGTYDTTNTSIGSGSTIDVGTAGTLDIGTNDITVTWSPRAAARFANGGHLNPTNGVIVIAGTIKHPSLR